MIFFVTKFTFLYFSRSVHKSIKSVFWCAQPAKWGKLSRYAFGFRRPPMPSSELLSQRLVQAIDDRNLKALNRWLKHPRFDPGRADNANALLASLCHADAAVWLESLLSAGVPLRKIAGGSEAIHEAARLGNVGAVRWLLDKGVPANASSHYGTTMLHGVLNGLGPVLPEHNDLVQLLWERTGSIEDLFGWQPRHLRMFVE